MRGNADPAPILDLIEAFRRSKTMFTAVRLGIFDQLEAEPQPAEALAAKLNLNAGALPRLLNACVALELLGRNDQIYENTRRASKYLVTTSPDTLVGYITYSDQSLFHLWVISTMPFAKERIAGRRHLAAAMRSSITTSAILLPRRASLAR